MSDSRKICPTCETSNSPNAPVCTNCGTNLRHVFPVASGETSHEQAFDFRQGETDLLESSLSGSATFYLILAITILLVLVLAGFGFFLASDYFAPAPLESSPEAVMSPSNLPTLNAATVTLGPPTMTHTFTPAPTFTPTDTPTQGPCVITLPQGQTLIWALGQCGHRSLDVMPTVLALNNLSDAANVREGQQIQIPYPTPTQDSNALPTATAEGDANADTDSSDGSIVLVDESIEAFQATVTPTLPPGVMWHQVQQGENIIAIAFQYNTDVQTLSQLNRQIDFARCDFGDTYGGPECIVQLFQGQLLRVPAPTPTPTLSPTPDPNATATPTPTATYNVPQAFSPTDRQFFYADELVTLRWVASASLSSNEYYRVDVRDLTAGISYTALTADLFFTLPLDWQGQSQARHEYQWKVGIVNQDNPESIRYQTAPQVFVWQGIPPTTESD